MMSIYFIIECSAVPYPNQVAVAKQWLEKAFNKTFFYEKSTKDAASNNALNLLSKIMPSYFLPFFESVKVKSPSLFFAFSLTLTIKCIYLDLT